MGHFEHSLLDKTLWWTDMSYLSFCGIGLCCFRRSMDSLHKMTKTRRETLHERSNETGQLISKGIFSIKENYQFCQIQIISILQFFLSSINWTRPPGMESILDFLETQVKITPGERCQLLVTCIIWLVSGQYLAKKRGRNLYHFTKCTSESIKASWAPAEWQNKFVKHKVLSDSEVTWDKIYLFNI